MYPLFYALKNVTHFGSKAEVQNDSNEIFFSYFANLSKGLPMSDLIIINFMNASMNLSMKYLSKVGPLAASNTKIDYLKFGFFKEKRANKTKIRMAMNHTTNQNNVKVKV